jgi:hypothetical protein
LKIIIVRVVWTVINKNIQLSVEEFMIDVLVRIARSGKVALLSFSIFCANTVTAAPIITYTATNVSGSTWTYQYALTNTAPTGVISEFTTWFDRAKYSNLSVVATPATWNSIAIQPDFGIPADGFFDSLALGTGLGINASLTGFSVRFNYLASGTPGAQPFEIINPSTFLTLYSGTTSLAGSSGSGTGTSVDAPATFALLAVSLVALARTRRRAEKH